MDIKRFSLLVLGFLAVFIMTSCNSDDEVEIKDPSKDAQIVSFSVSGKMTTAIDSITYPTLNKTKFTIIAKSGKIFNEDSLLVNTSINKLKVSLKYSGYPRKVELVYRDSTSTWNTTDSVEFSPGGYPKFKVTASDGLTVKEYSVEFRIHKIDPDSIAWGKMASIPTSGQSKTVTNEAVDKFYSFVKNGTTSIKLHTSELKNFNWSTGQDTNLPVNDVILESLVHANGLFAITTKDEKSYTSTDGITWGEKSGLTNIIGVFPKEIETDPNQILVTYKNSDNKLIFGKTTDFTSITEVEKLSNLPKSNLVPSDFPVKEYSTVLFDDPEIGKQLIITGGKDSNGNIIKKSWLVVDIANNEINPSYGYNTETYPHDKGLSTFIYDKQLYSFAQDSLYVSKIGDVWKKAPKKQVIDKKMADINRPNIIVDKENKIWIFGGISSKNIYSSSVWTGRLNKLIPKE